MHAPNRSEFPVKILRKSEAAARLGCGISTFYEKYVKPGRVKLIYLGKRSVGALESDIDRVIGELVAESAAHPNRRALAPKPKRGRGRPAREAVAQAQVSATDATSERGWDYLK